MDVRSYLKSKIPEEELRFIPRSFDIIGSREKAVAIVEIPEEIYHRRVLIAEAIMKIHKNVKTVLAKRSPRVGVYRTRNYELIAGDPNTEVIHKEHGCYFKLDPTKVYFSPRESTERLRIARQVAPGDFVVLMFAGVCPYGIVIAKVQPLVKKIVAIEINPIAYNYMVENIKLNKLEDKIMPVLGDVKVEASEWYGMADRVIMPLPKGAQYYLDEAFNCLREDGGIIHFYHWAHEENLYDEAITIIEEHARKHNYKIEILNKRKVLPYAPRIYKICIDFRAFR